MEPAKQTDTEAMPKFDPARDAQKLNSTELAYMRRVEFENLERARKVQRYRKANNITGIALALGVVGIYSYTIYAVKQEKFLDDFEEPEKIIGKSG